MKSRPALESFVLQKKLSPRKVRNLLLVAELSDRLSTKPYMRKEEIENLEKKYSARPDVTTWGDYFAAEIATDHWRKDDAEFEKICETVMFDFIASVFIFSGKNAAFFACVRDEYRAALKMEEGENSTEREEKLHLGILEEYYTRMGLNKDKLTQEDMEFFDTFSVKSQTA